MITHDPSLVILSITIAMLGTFTACVMTSGAALLPRSETRIRLLMATASLGGSIWASHFVGLLAIEATINWTYNPLFLGLSAVTAFCGTGIALFLTKIPPDADGARMPAITLVLGLAIAATQYSGLGAITGWNLNLSWFLATITVAFSIQVAALVMWFLFRPRGVVITLAGAVVLGLAIAAAHYLSISSAPALEQTLAAIPKDASPISGRYLAWSTTIMMYLVCSICLCIFVIMQFQEEIQQ